MFRKAIAQWTFPRDDQSTFATDGQKTIISWKKLHSSMDAAKLVDQPTGQDNVGASWSEDIVNGTNLTTTARFSCVGPVNTTDLLSQTNCNIAKAKLDLTSVERCISILISKSFDNPVVKLLGKKFYVRNSRSALGNSKSLEPSEATTSPFDLRLAVFC